MQIGMLWLDDDQKRPLEEKVERAAAYYQDKYGQTPTLCFVNAKAVAERTTIGRIDVRPAKHVMPSHFWLGVDAV
ncbi:MAG: hypothetical protein KDE09_09965 [Anaerolineales bacterium]|nr:hypothetical protein [Anaerolineales bacterium]MCB0006197.1 hypothetical protein [Anaerolineales bacterium]MCB0011313.1 hypothetical protein [Anaerolineales bacterium]MCB0018102.1 hypothetical protein [Anaerolineales bacterium]MCB8961860.1 hypothetical protein [Ardenticatenales bacterium]